MFKLSIALLGVLFLTNCGNSEKKQTKKIIRDNQLQKVENIIANEKLIGFWCVSQYSINFKNTNSSHSQILSTVKIDSSNVIEFTKKNEVKCDNKIISKWKIEGNQLNFEGDEVNNEQSSPFLNNLNYTFGYNRNYINMNTNLKNTKNGTYIIAYRLIRK